MPLAPGSLVGPYQIIAPLGAGAMGEVYRARDTRLNRDVAIKLLVPTLTADAVALARFGREAQVLAALSHPNIVAIYDVGQHEGRAFVVMEYLEGETLRRRMHVARLPLRRTIDHAIQLASALAAAHQRGIVHRDLKPENIFVTADGPLKVLDLGLATLVLGTSAASGAASISPDLSTKPGTVLGTVGYMAPEQARGQAVDPRADLFSLGAVLYEMAIGRRAFAGDTAVDTLAAVLNVEPAEFPLDAQVPPALDRIIRRCLEKRPEDRFQSARDLAFALEGVATGSTVSRGLPVPAGERRRTVPIWALAAATLVALVLGAAADRTLTTRTTFEAPDELGSTRLTIEANRGAVPEVLVSPDGRRLAWTALGDGARPGGIWVRGLDEARPTVLPGTPSSGTMFWSPDGREIVVADRDMRLVAIDVQRGTERMLHELGQQHPPLRGGDWVGHRLLIGAGGAISLIDTSGQEPRRAVTTVKPGAEQWHGWPSWLGDGPRFIYTAAISDGKTEGRIASIDDTAVTRLALPTTATGVRYDPRGYLLFGNGGSLFAQRIDVTRRALEGPPIRVAAEVLQNRGTGWTAIGVSRNGVLAWRAPGFDEVQFEWVDRAGRTLSTLGRVDAYTNFDLSPDGSRVVVTLRREDAGASLYLLDTARNVATLISEQPVAEPISDPTWAPDGQTVAYRHGMRLVTRNALGGEERPLRPWPGYPDSWSRDGKYVTVGRSQGGEYGLWAIALDGKSPDIPLVNGIPVADEPKFSPDGRWVVFHAALQADAEVYAIRFPPTGERWQLSTAGGVQPRWRADGHELYYLAPDGQLMSLDIPNGDPTRAGKPAVLFSLRMQPSVAFDQFAPSADGQRFLVRRPLRPGGADTAPVHVLVHWDRATAFTR